MPDDASWIEGEDSFDAFAYGAVRRARGESRFDAEHVRHDLAVFTLAGPMAEARFAGAGRVRMSPDEKDQLDRIFSLSRADDPRLRQDYFTLTRLLVEERWAAIDAVARELIARRFLEFREVRRIVKAA